MLRPAPLPVYLIDRQCNRRQSGNYSTHDNGDFFQLLPHLVLTRKLMGYFVINPQYERLAKKVLMVARV